MCGVFLHLNYIRPTREIHTGGDPHPILKRKYRWNRVEERRRAGERDAGHFSVSARKCVRLDRLCRKPIRSAGVDLGADDAHDLLLDLGLLCVNISIAHLTVLIPERDTSHLKNISSENHDDRILLCELSYFYYSAYISTVQYIYTCSM